MTGGRTKAADVLSVLGAAVLGAGLALLAPGLLAGVAPHLVAVGLLVHGAGMTLRHRLDQRAGPLTWWERALFWSCWAALALVAVPTTLALVRA